ncbi:MAG: PQQ-binding-like beta-propeller repeat protein [Aureispira sp.]|nr:PQQ-binding-like beta-propeller repeat protein [Aureispira sp.]
MKIILSCAILLFTTLTVSWAQEDAFGVFVENGKFGLKYEDESIVLDAKYEYIYQHPSGSYLFFEAKKGETPEKFSPTTHFIQKDDKITINAPKGTSFGIFNLDHSAKVDKNRYSQWVERSDFPVQLFDKKFYYLMNIDDLEILNKKGFQELVCQNTHDQIWTYKQKNKWGVISTGTYYIEYDVEAKYEDIKVYSAEDEYYQAKKKGKWGVISRHNSKPFINFDYDEVLLTPSLDPDQSTTCWIPVRQGKKWGLYYSDYEYIYKVLDLEYDQIMPLDALHVQATQQNKAGILRLEDMAALHDGKTGEDVVQTILPLEYDSITTAKDAPKYELDPETLEDILVGYQASEFLIIHQNGKKGLLSKGDYKLELAPKYDELNFTFDPKVILTQLNGKYGILQKEDLKNLHPATLDNIEKGSNGNISIYMDNKKGVFSLDKMQILLQPTYDDYTIDWYFKGDGAQYYAIVNIGEKEGLIEVPSNETLVPVEYDELMTKDFKNHAFCVRNGDQYGIIGKDQKLILPIEYNKIDYWNDDKTKNYVRVLKDKKYGIFNLKAGKMHIPLEWDELSAQSEGIFSARKGEKSAEIDLASKKITFHKAVNDQFQLKWKTKIGITTFRTNIMMANGLLLVGSNGETRDQVKEDKLDGLYMLNPKDGKVVRQLKPVSLGDDDVNGVAVAGKRLYFGGDNDYIFCFDFNGKKLWEHKANGDIEGSPVLFDINGDKTLDAVFAIESPAQLLALDGKTGKQLWVYESTHRGYFMATPTAYDVSGDHIPDVLIGLGGGNNFLAVNGENGELIWAFSTLSSAGFVNGSAVHASATVLENKKKEVSIVVSECYGLIHFLNKKGSLERYTSAPSGLFSSPVFASNGSFGFGSNWNTSFKVSNGGNPKHWKLQDSKEFPYVYIEDQYESILSTKGAISSSAFVADVLGNGQTQFGIADESGLFYLVDQNGKELMKLSLAAGVESPIFVKDIDNDGKLEILIACLDGYMYCFDTQSKGKVHWGQFRGNNQNIATLKHSWW